MKSGRKVFFVAIIMVVVMCFAGCMPRESSMEEEVKVSSEDGIYEEIFDPNDLAWRDNSLDAYSARFNQRLKVTDDESDEFFLGGCCAVLGNGRLSYFQKHVGMYDYKKGWDELVIATNQQKIDNVRLMFPFTPDNFNQAWLMGEVYGNDHYICLNFEGTNENKIYHIFEVDEDLRVVNDFYADCFSKEEWEAPDAIYQDRDGNVHVLTSFVDESFSRYYVFRADGSLTGQCFLETSENGGNGLNAFRFRPMSDGTLSIQRCYTDEQGIICGTELFKKDVITQKETVLTSQDNEVTGEVVYYQLGADNSIIYMNRQGIYKCNVYWENVETIYLWSNHGITFRGGAIKLLDNDEICVYYVGDDGNHYMVLTPTKEKVEITEINFVTDRSFIFQPIVDQFNKAHPSFHVELKSGYDRTKLLSEMIAGQGPVLIDTALIGFEEQERLWEPLDGMLKATGLEGELNEKALECCRINGKTLGLAGDYVVKTVITTKPEIRDGWTQEDFINEIAKSSSIQVIFPPVPLNYSGNTLIFEYLMHGIDDNYLLNQEKELHEENLNRVFDLAEKYCTDRETESGATLVQGGHAFCANIVIRGLSEILAIEKAYGRNVRYVGYPSVHGGTHFISTDSPVSIRRNATGEEKKAAYTFLKEWMSYDGQIAFSKRNVNYGISIRDDVMEEQIQSIIQNELANISDGSDANSKVYEQELQEWARLLKDIIETAVPLEKLPRNLEELMWEELTEYFNGNITREQVIDHLKKRIRLYFEEHQNEPKTFRTQ